MALLSFITKSPCLRTGTLCCGLSARNSGFMCSPIIKLVSITSYEIPATSAVMKAILHGGEPSIP
uniref:Uncharacterized protein n=1 Tax=Lepeophtheirus salmonis TaxID=72036 RepID=A0A0K2U0U4_LEPSM